MHHPEVQTYRSGGATIPYMDYRKPDDGRPLVLFHGISMDENHWGDLPYALDRPVVTVGFPKGERRPHLPTIHHYARQMERAIPHILGGQEFDELGLSWGGLLVQGIRRGVNKRIIAASLPAAPTLYLKPNIPDPKALRVVMSSHRRPEDAADLYGGDIRRNPALLDALPIDRHISMFRHMKQEFAAMTSGYLIVQNMLARSMPATLVMAGTDDPLMRFDRVHEAAAWLGAEFSAVEEGGHGFLLTRPEESAAIINTFLDGPAGSATVA